MYNLHFILCNESQWKICLCAAKRDLKSQLIKTLMFIFPPCKMKTGYSRLGVVQRFCNVKWVSEWSRSVMSDSLRPLNCSLPGSSIRGIFQARILEWVAISFSRGVFLTQGLNPGLQHWRQMLYRLSHQRNLEKAVYGTNWESSIDINTLPRANR